MQTPKAMIALLVALMMGLALPANSRGSEVLRSKWTGETAVATVTTYSECGGKQTSALLGHNTYGIGKSTTDRYNYFFWSLEWGCGKPSVWSEGEGYDLNASAFEKVEFKGNSALLKGNFVVHNDDTKRWLPVDLSWNLLPGGYQSSCGSQFNSRDPWGTYRALYKGHTQEAQITGKLDGVEAETAAYIDASLSKNGGLEIFKLAK